MNWNLFSIINWQKNETNNYNTDVSTLIEPIKELFNKFDITNAFKSLQLSMDSSIGNARVLYKLFLLRASFELKLHDVDKFIATMEYIKNAYVDFIKSDINFTELNLTYLSLLSNEEEYFLLAEEFSKIKNIDIEYFQAVFYINNKDTDKAKEIFDIKYPDIHNIKPNIALIHAYIFNQLMVSNETMELNYSKMVLCYDKYLDEIEIVNNYELLSINIFKCTLPLEHFYEEKVLSEEDIKMLNTAICNIELVLDEVNHFGKAYQLTLINNLLNFYKCVNYTNKFETIAKSNISLLNSLNTTDYYLQIYKNINSDKVFEIYNETNFIDLLTAYIGQLFDKKNYTEIIEFTEKNNLLLVDHNFIELYYDFAMIEEKINLNSINKKYESVKNDTIFNAVLYLKSSMYLKKTVQISYLIELIRIIEKEQPHEKLIIELLKILFHFGQGKIAFHIVLESRDNYKYLDNGILEISQETQNLRLNDLESFISESDNKLDNHSHYIGNIYASFHNYYKAYKYYYKHWKKNNSVELAKIIFDLIIRIKNLYVTFEDNEEFSTILAYLTVNGVFNEIEVALMGTYNHFENQEYKEAVVLFNKKLLTMDFQLIEVESLNIISTLYFKSITIPDENVLNLISENKIIIETPLQNMIFSENNEKTLCYCIPFNQISWINHISNNKYYISSQYRSVLKSTYFKLYNFNYKSDRELSLFSKFYKQKSLYHLISNMLIHKSKDIKMIKTNLGQENQFEELFILLKEQSEHDASLLNHYNDGGFMPLYHLAKSDFKNIPPLMIRELLENPKNKFLAGHNNPLNTKSKKILTLSSLMLIKYLGHLEKVLELEDIYVQETVLNWIEATKESLKHDKSTMSMSYKDGQYYKYESTQEEKDGLVQVYEDTYNLLLKLVLKKRIVKDYEYVIPVKIPVEVILNIGHLDFYAIGFAINNNFQLITEDNSSTKLYESFKYNTQYISNMIPILQRALNYDDFVDLSYELHKMSYSEILNNSHLDSLYKLLENNSLITLEKEDEENLTKVINIFNDNNLLEDLKLEYKQKYMNQDIFGKDILFKNLEYLLSLICND